MYQGRVGPPSANLAVAAANHRGRASVGGVGSGPANAVVSRGVAFFCAAFTVLSVFCYNLNEIYAKHKHWCFKVCDVKVFCMRRNLAIVQRVN